MEQNPINKISKYTRGVLLDLVIDTLMTTEESRLTKTGLEPKQISSSTHEKILKKASSIVSEIEQQFLNLTFDELKQLLDATLEIELKG
jgi:hypothetical protein